MSILYRTKQWLTIAQLARGWAPELPGAARDLEQCEREFVHLLLEDIVNKRLDDTGPLMDGQRLGLCVITPDYRAGFLDGDQARHLLLSDEGVRTFYLDRIVVMKEAALDFAHRHGLPPPSWWSDAVAVATEPSKHLTPQTTVSTPDAVSTNSAQTSPKRPRGRKPIKLEQVVEAMSNDVRQGRRTLAQLDDMLEKDLAAEYGVSRDTARKARNAVSEFVENSIGDK